MLAFAFLVVNLLFLLSALIWFGWLVFAFLFLFLFIVFFFFCSPRAAPANLLQELECSGALAGDDMRVVVPAESIEWMLEGSAWARDARRDHGGAGRLGKNPRTSRLALRRRTHDQLGAIPGRRCKGKQK